MKILFADALPESYVDLLRRQGDECIVSPELDADDIPDVIKGVDVLVVRSTRVTAATIDRSDNLGLIVRAGAGTNTIDCQAASTSEESPKSSSTSRKSYRQVYKLWSVPQGIEQLQSSRRSQAPQEQGQACRRPSRKILIRQSPKVDSSGLRALGNLVCQHVYCGKFIITVWNSG